MKKVVIIEEQEDIRLLLQIYFKRFDSYAVMAAADPSACPVYRHERCQCPKGTPCGDVLIIDNYLPKMTGLEFIRRQAARGCKGAARKKAVMSAGFTAADIVLAMELGCKLFPKPFRLQELAAWIESVTVPTSL
jgi:DNA-binding response OmpR family regulator